MNNPIQLHRDDDPAGQNLVLAGRTDSVAEDDRLDLAGLFSVIRRRRTLFLCVAGGIFLLGMVLTFLQTPLYTATATVVIDTAKPQVAPPTDAPALIDLAGTTSNQVDTEVQVLLSSDLANRVASALNLDKSPRYDPAKDVPGLRARVWSTVSGEKIPVPTRAYDAQAQRDYVTTQLISNLQVVRTTTTYALVINFTSDDPAYSAAIANEYAKQYARQSMERKRQANETSKQFLMSRLNELRAEAETNTRALQEYRVAHNLLSANASQLTEQEVSNYDQEVATARAAAAEDRARLATAQRQLQSGSNGDDVGEALNSPVVTQLRTQRAQLASQLANLTAKYGQRHPDVITTKDQLANLDNSIQAEINRVISNLHAKTAVSSGRLGSIQSSLSGARGTLTSSNKALVGFDDLSRKAETSQTLYEAYLNRFKELAAQEGTEQADARTITWAQVPGSQSSPIIILNLVLSIVLGIGAGLAAAFISELSFRGMTTGEDIESRLAIPYLGAVPLVGSVFKWKGAPIDALLDRPHSAFAESFRSLMTSLNYAVDVVAQVVVVTSALPQEGKSTIAAGLARIAAKDGQSVVLIDCDLRRRSVNKMVIQPRTVGLMELLNGTASIDDALVLDEPSGVWLLPLNGDKIEPGEHFSGDPMQNLINKLRARFTLIVLDTAPILPIADTRVLATLADAVVFVVRWRKTSDHAVRSALRLLPRGRVSLAGAVLSQVDARKQARFGYGDATYYYSQYKDYYA